MSELNDNIDSDSNSNYFGSLFVSVLVITIIFLISLGSYLSGSRRNKQAGDFMNGFWKADPSWCSKAGISNAYATINFFPDKQYGVIYLLMQNNDGQLIDNNSYRFSTKISLNEMFFKKHNIECHLVFEDGKNPVSGKFPISCKLRINVEHGVLAIHDGETVFLELYKDNITSSRVERMTHEKFSECFLQQQERTDPQEDTNEDTKEKYLVGQPKTDPQSDVHTDGESIVKSSDPLEGQAI